MADNKTESDDVLVMSKIRECLKVPSEFGHSDLGDFLLHYAKGKYSLERFLWSCDVTFLGSEREPPDDGEDDEDEDDE